MNDHKENMLPRIVAVCGLKRSGKDCFADAICATYGYEKIKIAEGLKDMLKVLFDFTDEQLETDAKDIVDPTLGVSPRKVMQFMGTEIMQHEIQKLLPTVGRNFWVNKLINKHIEKHPHKKFVISDLRFYHEYERLLAYKPYIIRVERQSTLQSYHGKCTHPSETEFIKIPVNNVFHNNDSIGHLQEHASKLFNQT